MRRSGTIRAKSLMPLPISVDALLHGRAVEWERLEFKEGWNPLPTLHTICAFANDFHNLGGGYIVIGVEERNDRPILPPKGIDPGRAHAIQKQVLELGHSSLRPSYHPITVPYERDGRSILIIWAPGGQRRPYKARTALGAGSPEWGYFIRKGSSTVKARGSDEAELLSLAASVPCDDRVNQRARIGDLSRKLIRSFLAEVGSDLAPAAARMPVAVLGRQMNIVGGTHEALFPLNVGLLFFNPDPRRFLPLTQIDVVWFPDGPGGDRFAEKTFYGPLDRMTREALDYIRRNYIHEVVIKHPDRAESTRVENFPYAAVEEVVVNAIYHRSYEEREPVEVRITPEELVVLSFPGPDRSIRLKQLRVGRAVSRRYRNRRIGEFLKELELTEGRGTGIPKILRAMRSNGSPPPEFETDDDRISFVVRLPVHPEAARLAAEARQEGIGGTTQVAEQATGQVTQQVTQQVTPQVAAQILMFCRIPRSAAEIQARVGLRDRPHFQSAYLRPLLEAGWLARTIPDKPRSRLQRYRTTETGEKQVKAIAGDRA